MIKFAQKKDDGKVVIYIGLSAMNIQAMKIEKIEEREPNEHFIGPLEVVTEPGLPIVVMGRDIGVGDIVEFITITYDSIPIAVKTWGTAISIKLSRETVKLLMKNGIVIRNPKLPAGLDAILLDYGETPIEIMKKLKKNGIESKVVQTSFSEGPLL